MRRRPLTVFRATAVTVVACASVLGAATSGFATAASGPVAPKPAVGTPQLAPNGSTEQVRQLVQCGSMMYAVGTFTRIKWKTTTYIRTNAFSFSAIAPYTMSSWDPEVNGLVNSIAFNGTNCSTAYLGGKFSAVGGTAAKNIAAVSTTTGAVVPTFTHSANGEVDTIVGWNGHLLTGGAFTSISASALDPYFTSLNPATGKNDGYLNLAISGNYHYVDDGGNAAGTNPTRIYNQQLSHNGTRDLVEGDFTTIGGQPRRQIAMLDLGAGTATTDPWNATEFNQNCAISEPFYAKAAAWSPDDQTVYVATTGYKPANGPAYNTSAPRSGVCDTASAFPATAGVVSHLWINYTGCDSLYSTAADSSTAYFGGHERWANNQFGCDAAGAGAVAAPGMVGLSPTNGAVTFNPTRARGLGADDMLITSAGLWIASDNATSASQCGGVFGHAGICLLPYPKP
jgi:hypothetical protein